MIMNRKASTVSAQHCRLDLKVRTPFYEIMGAGGVHLEKVPLLIATFNSIHGYISTLDLAPGGECSNYFIRKLFLKCHLCLQSL